jgi:hypothetical protein
MQPDSLRLAPQAAHPFAADKALPSSASWSVAVRRLKAQRQEHRSGQRGDQVDWIQLSADGAGADEAGWAGRYASAANKFAGFSHAGNPI